MDAKEKMNRLFSKTLGLFEFMVEERNKPSEKVQSRSDSGLEMLRVTDSRGCEYLCPLNMLRDTNFVSEREKDNCVDYSLISHHAAMEP